MPSLKLPMFSTPFSTQYEIYVEGLTGPVGSPTVSQRSNVKSFVTTAAGTPGISARGQGTTGGVVEVHGPSGTWTSYQVTVCNLRSSACKTVPCAKAAQDPSTCSLSGLEDDCPYSVQVGSIGWAERAAHCLL